MPLPASRPRQRSAKRRSRECWLAYRGASSRTCGGSLSPAWAGATMSAYLGGKPGSSGGSPLGGGGGGGGSGGAGGISSGGGWGSCAGGGRRRPLSSGG